LKIYTGFGDKGKTRLIGGKIVYKNHLRVKAYGAMDELNSSIGLLITYIDDEVLEQDLQGIQKRIFELSAELANQNATSDDPAITAEIIKYLEKQIDTIDSQLEPLKNFILPGGSRSSAHCHLTRTICRRGERDIIALQEVDKVNENLVTYVNRLSDYFFVLARLLNKNDGTKDIPWIS
jgi:cob(I)alamin adenosyltransferase